MPEVMNCDSTWLNHNAGFDFQNGGTFTDTLAISGSGSGLGRGPGEVILKQLHKTLQTGKITGTKQLEHCEHINRTNINNTRGKRSRRGHQFGRAIYHLFYKYGFKDLRIKQRTSNVTIILIYLILNVSIRLTEIICAEYRALQYYIAKMLHV